MNTCAGSERLDEFDNDAFIALVELDPKLSMRKVAGALGATWSTVH